MAKSYEVAFRAYSTVLHSRTFLDTPREVKCNFPANCFHRDGYLLCAGRLWEWCRRGLRVSPPPPELQFGMKSEPRFKTEADVVIHLLQEEAHRLGRIVDVSGAGLRLLINEAVAIGEPLRLIVGEYHVLAIVRYCVPSEGAYSVGVERVDEWLPGADAALPGRVPGQDDALAIGRPQLKAHLGCLRTHALRDLFSRQSATKGPQRLVLGGIAAAMALGLLVLFFRHPW
jgi:hypothetical protein